MKHCKDLSIYLTDGELKNIDGNDLYQELVILGILLRTIQPHSKLWAS